ncbi:MAG: ParB N-terminal domain-containing protein [Roseburia sp.]|nr:ParB N-terminal domain-containing protein [Roseburia sp.]MCM1277949.1 ParB N-terminal domain-containing protein [Robinsoniella sp.]
MAERQRFKFRINGAEGENKEMEKEQPAQGQVAERVRRVEEKKDKLPFEIKYIPRQKIKENKKNHYPKEKMESLQESILQFGLQQNLSVIYLTEDDSFVLEAGHRRTQALDNLIQEFANYEDEEDARYQMYLRNVHEYSRKGYPCRVTAILSDNVQYDYEDEDNLEQIPDEVIDSEIRLIATNEEVRRADTATQALNVARLKKLYERKNMGKSRKEMIAVTKQIAEDLHISEKQVRRYDAIDRLIPELKEAFTERQITLSEGMNFAKLTEDEQRLILSLVKKGEKVSREEIEMLRKENAELEKEIQKKALQIKEKENPSDEDKKELEKLRKEIKSLKAEKMEMPELIKVEWKVSQQCENLKQVLFLLIRDLDELKKNSEKSIPSNRELLDRHGVLELLQEIVKN